MKKIARLQQWLIDHADWVYLNEIPCDQWGMSKPSCGSALRELCKSNRADFRIVGLTQYRGKLSPQQRRPKPYCRFDGVHLHRGTQSLHRTKQGCNWRLFWRIKSVRTKETK